MNRYTQADGTFRIDPPLAWPEFKTSPYRPEQARSEPDVLFEIETTEVDSPDGVMLLHRAVAVRPFAPGKQFAYRTGLAETLRKLLGEYGERHAFTGFFECRETRGDGLEDWYRLIVRGGNVVRIEPTITWED